MLKTYKNCLEGTWTGIINYRLINGIDIFNF
jgi:hypothetical protein